MLSRSNPSKSSIFGPTNEESFYTVGGEIDQNPVGASYDRSLMNHVQYTVIKTIHQASKLKDVNSEKFEDYLRPQQRLCTPSLKNKPTILKFSLDRVLYLAARERWAGEEGLVFISHDPSCYAPEE